MVNTRSAAKTKNQNCVVPRSRELHVFVRPVQPALLPGSPRADDFHVLIIGLPRDRDKEERPKE